MGGGWEWVSRGDLVHQGEMYRLQEFSGIAEYGQHQRVDVVVTKL